MLSHRQSGILLHPTSLPGPQAVGCLGSDAYRFIDFLAAAGQTVWQILPLGPTGYGNCPYSSFSAFAGTPLLISLELLVAEGDLEQQQLPNAPATDNADYASAIDIQEPLLEQACKRFKNTTSDQRLNNFNQFCTENSFWLEDYALFEALRRVHNFSDWQSWPAAVRSRDPEAMAAVKEQLGDAIYLQKYQQFIFFEQWFALKAYANNKGIQIYGDLPIFVALNSADVWANQQQYHLDESGQPTLVAGVPPDYFSATGQRWGNPLYRWEQMAANDFIWWHQRFTWNFRLFDLLRVDHFRGFSACWAINASEETAINGYWLESPGQELFTSLRNSFATLPIIAEDLGIITPDVEKLRDDFSFPGMKILQFAFDSDAKNPYLPHNHIPNSVVYTGTHDNNTTLGWWQGLDQAMQQRILSYLNLDNVDMPWQLIATALASVSRLAILPLQDILGLPAEQRMNIPGTAENNWQWRYLPDVLNHQLATKLREISQIYGRNLC